MMTMTVGANIRYTVDGTTPTETYGTLVAASSGSTSVTPATYTAPTRLRAVAFEPGWSNSAVHEDDYSADNTSSDPCYPVAYIGCDEGPQ
jgi:hypothetical protein